MLLLFLFILTTVIKKTIEIAFKYEIQNKFTIYIHNL